MARLRTLVICEKPSAAAKVAQAIDEENVPQRLKSHGVPYFECGTKEGSVVVCSAVGHLYTIDSKGRSNRQLYPIWDNRWRPKDQEKSSLEIRSKWIHAIQSLAKNADHFVNACDYDAEGSLIGHMLLSRACNAPPSQSSRMIFSTMTETELRSAFKTAKPALDIALAEAARCRHELDWFYGVNLSRVFTDSVLRESGGYTTLSAGRVQGPTLNFVVNKEGDISSFVPIPFWTINTNVEIGNQSYSVEYHRERIPILKEAEKIVSDCGGGLLLVKETRKRHIEQKPPYPFDLSGLQSEAFRHFGFNPSRTLALAEKLYLDALISYPRTSSQRLPPTIAVKNIVKTLGSQPNFAPLSSKLLQKNWLRPSQGSKEDPAHPAIHPTGEAPRHALAGPEARLYDLIVRRFLAVLAPSAVNLAQTVVMEKGEHTFFLLGSSPEELGWTEFYRPYSSTEHRQIPPLEAGSRVPILDIESRESFSQPPPRFSQLSLLKKMEETGIGTKATRAGIIDILYERGYVNGSRIQASRLATTIIALLERYCRQIIDVDFTSEIEGSMDQIEAKETSRKLVLANSILRLRGVMRELMDREGELGTQLAGVLHNQRLVDSLFNTPCPRCGSALSVVRNKRTGKRFVGCTGRWDRDCKFTLPLPQYGGLTILKRFCKECGFQMIQARSRGRSLISCPNCYKTRAATKEPRGSSGQAEAKLEADTGPVT